MFIIIDTQKQKKQSKGKGYGCIKIKEGQNVCTTRKKNPLRKLAIISKGAFHLVRGKKKNTVKSEVILKMFCNCLPGLSHGY